MFAVTVIFSLKNLKIKRFIHQSKRQMKRAKNRKDVANHKNPLYYYFFSWSMCVCVFVFLFLLLRFFSFLFSSINDKCILNLLLYRFAPLRLVEYVVDRIIAINISNAKRTKKKKEKKLTKNKQREEKKHAHKICETGINRSTCTHMRPFGSN